MVKFGRLLTTDNVTGSTLKILDNATGWTMRQACCTGRLSRHANETRNLTGCLQIHEHQIDWYAFDKRLH